MRKVSRHFTSYLRDGVLPYTAFETRRIPARGVALAVINHAPAHGVEYQPVDDLIISIVLRSRYGRVVRDLGSGRQVFKETPDCILVTPARTASFWSFAGTPQVMHIVIPTQRVEEYLELHCADGAASLSRLAAGPIVDPFVGMLAARMWQASGRDDVLARTFADQAVTMLLTSLFATFAGRSAACDAGTRLAPWRCRQITELMLARIGAKLTAKELAGEVGLSASHFARAFKATLGRSPHQWLTEQRIERAKELMGSTALSITEIALSLGFSSPGHFSAVFRAMTGSSPRDWRLSFPRQG